MKHAFKIYRKPTQTNHTIHSTSNHPPQHKLSAYQHMIVRLNTIPMQKEDYDNEMKIIKQIAHCNGYNGNIMESMNNKFQHREHIRQLTTLTTEGVPQKIKYITVNYDKTSMHIINKTLKQYNYVPAYSTCNKLQQRVNTHRQDRNECPSGVYNLKCNDCEAFYIGQTGRTFPTRFAEHVQEIGKPNIKSNYALHLTNEQHNYTSYDENLQILHRLKKGDRMNRLEEMEIYRHRNNPLLLNDKMPYNSLYEIVKNHQNH